MLRRARVRRRVGASRVVLVADGGATNGRLGRMNGVDVRAAGADTLITPGAAWINRQKPEAIMQSKPKSNSVVTHSLAEDGCTLTFRVLNAGEFTFDVLSAHASVQHRAAVHGFIQRISDAAAKSRDTETGKSATPADKLAAMQRVAEHYASGVDQWALVRASGDGAGAGPSIVVRAFAQLQGLSVSDALTRIREVAEKRRTTTKAYLKTLRGAEAIRGAIAAIEAEEAGTGGDEALAELLGESDEAEAGEGEGE